MSVLHLQLGVFTYIHTKNRQTHTTHIHSGKHTQDYGEIENKSVFSNFSFELFFIQAQEKYCPQLVRAGRVKLFIRLPTSTKLHLEPQFWSIISQSVLIFNSNYKPNAEIVYRTYFNIVQS